MMTEVTPPPPAGVPAEVLRRSTVFGGSQTRPMGLFHGGHVTAVFAGAKVDLRDALVPPGGARLEAKAVFGMVEVLVPRNWKVVVTGSNVFGDVASEGSSADPGAPVLEVSGLALFGTVRVRT